VLPAVLLIGLGLGTMSPVAANLATFQVPEHESGIASAVFNASEQVGASIGLAVLNTIAATSTGAYLAAHPRPRDAHLAGLVHGYTTATGWAAAILGITAIVVLILVNARLDTPEPTAMAASKPDSPTCQRPVAGHRDLVSAGRPRRVPRRARRSPQPARPSYPQSTRISALRKEPRS
jgi:MFS family permease